MVEFNPCRQITMAPISNYNSRPATVWNHGLLVENFKPRPPRSFLSFPFLCCPLPEPFSFRSSLLLHLRDSHCRLYREQKTTANARLPVQRTHRHAINSVTRSLESLVASSGLESGEHTRFNTLTAGPLGWRKSDIRVSEDRRK